jgi:hypothetical protein
MNILEKRLMVAKAGEASDMRTLIAADDGDQVAVIFGGFVPERSVVRIELRNNTYAGSEELDWIDLTADSARQLGLALLHASRALGS